MMMLDDALEPEYNDLGAEFAAQCAAENTYAQMNQPQMQQIPDESLFQNNMHDNMLFQNNSYGYDMHMDQINQHEMMNQVHHVEEVATSSNPSHVYQQENIGDAHAANTYSQEIPSAYTQQEQMRLPVSTSFANYNPSNVYQQESRVVHRPAANQYCQLPYNAEGAQVLQHGQAQQRTVTIDQQSRRMIVQRQPVYHQQVLHNSQPIYGQSMQGEQQRQPQVVYVRRLPGNQMSPVQQVYIQTPQGLVARQQQPVRVVRTVNQNGQPVTVIHRRIQRPTTMSSDGHQQDITPVSQNASNLQMGQRNEIIEHSNPNNGHMIGSHQIAQRERPAAMSQPSGSAMNAPLYHQQQRIVQYRPVNPLNSSQHHTVFHPNYIAESVSDNSQDQGYSAMPVSKMNCGENSENDVAQRSSEFVSDATNVSSTPVSISSIISTVRPPVPPIPRKKKPEAPVVSATDIAQAAALQRIGTEEGWKQMNTWLKTLSGEDKGSKVKDLLRQCLQAKISVDLLSSNDTPKFVRQLSKTHSDAEVKKLCSQCVIKWKKEVANPEVPATKKEKKPKDDPPVEDGDDEEMDAPLASLKKEETVSEELSPKEDTIKELKKSEKRKTSDNVDDSIKKEKKNKAKAKVYTAKSRLTGLEENSTDQPAVKKAKKEDEKSLSPDEKKKKDETLQFAKLPTLPKIPKKTKPVLPPTPQKITLSTGFMDALAVSTEPKKKIPVKKRSIEKKKEDPQPAPLSVLDGLFAEQAKQVEIGGPKPYSDLGASNSPAMPKAPSPVNDEDDAEMIPQSRRKIRFADEFGKDLVMIKEFEIEEGERINVNHMSPEDMKHHEMLMERRNKEQNTDVDDEEDKKQEIIWRLEPVDDVIVLALPGSQSEAKGIESERQKTAMRAFNDPSRPTTVFAEPEDFDPLSARKHVPPIIPLDPVDECDEQSSSGVNSESPVVQITPTPTPVEPISTTAPAASALPSSVQSLLDRLKKQGIVAGGEIATAVPPNVSSLVSSISSATLATISKLPSNIPVSNGDVMQQTYQQIPLNGPVISGNIYQQQTQPPLIHQIHPSTSTGQDAHDVDDSGPAAPMRHFNGPRPIGRVCQFYNTPRGCNFGDHCKFIHDDRAQPPGPRSGGYYRDRDNRVERRGGDWESGRVGDREERDWDNRDPERRDHRRDWGDREFRGRGRGFGGRGGFRGGRYEDRPPFRGYRGGERSGYRDGRDYSDRSANDHDSGMDEIQSPTNYIQSPKGNASTAASPAVMIPSERLPSTDSPASPPQD